METATDVIHESTITTITTQPDTTLQEQPLALTEKDLIFDLGLVMAGAVSAGAYTAGVVDFLLEALEAWEMAKEAEKHLPAEKRAVPFHKVRIKVLAGASAGGMTAAMVAATFRNKALGIEKETSLMKDIWVNQIDISNLLEDKDLATDPDSIRSILDSTKITEIADNAFTFHPSGKPWQPLSYVHDKLKLYITLSNLRGIPYEFNIAGETGFKYGMMKFTDYEEMVIHSDTTPEEWERIKDAAMATGAFPVGLSARLIHRDPREYLRRCKEDKMEFISLKFDEFGTYSFACVDGGVFNNEPLELARKGLYACSKQAQIEAEIRKDICYNATFGQEHENTSIQPKVPEQASGTTESQKREILLEKANKEVSNILMQASGIGEPEIVIQSGTGSAGNHPETGNPSQKPHEQQSTETEYQRYIRTLSHSLILVDPFPNIVEVTPENDKETSLHLFRVIPRLIAALRRQALFKPEELLVASHKKIYSSFMISPIRYTKKGHKADYPIASGFLDGFGGFFLKDFRKHDYELGRRNCQRFLQRYFTVPADEFSTNPIFSGSNGKLLEKYKCVEKYTENCQEKERVYYPIIPLMNGDELKNESASINGNPDSAPAKPSVPNMKQEEPQPEWPGYDKASFSTLIRKVNRRMKLIIDRLLLTSRTTRLVKHSWIIALVLAVLFAGINIVQWHIRSGNDTIISMPVLQISEILITPFLVLSGGAAFCYWYVRRKILNKIKKILRKQLTEYAFMD